MNIFSSQRTVIAIVAAVLALMSTSSAFAPSISSSKSVTELSMAPRFDKSTQRYANSIFIRQ